MVFADGAVERSRSRAPLYVRLRDAGHLDFYRAAAVDQLAAEQAEFLAEHLEPAAPEADSPRLTDSDG